MPQCKRCRQIKPKESFRDFGPKGLCFVCIECESDPYSADRLVEKRNATPKQQWLKQTLHNIHLKEK